MPAPLHVTLAAAVAITCAGIRDEGGTGASVSLLRSRDEDYEAFRKDFGVDRQHEDLHSYGRRVALFQTRRQEVVAHNAKPDQGWVAVVNKFADFTREEFHALLGHRHSRRGRPADAPMPTHMSSFVQSDTKQELAQTVDWRLKLNSSTGVKNQGACGSCWAVATVGALETHAEAYGQVAPEVSYEQLVDCVANPEACGGTGGCQGATSELAMEYIVKHGICHRSDYAGYETKRDSVCNPDCSTAISAKSFVRLPENEARPLREAAEREGPVAVSVDASKWSLYGHGVFGGCDRDAIVNHAVLLMGYGEDYVHGKYWLLRNSWGPDWGEAGYLRIFRHGDDEDFCGLDTAPQDGVGCRGGPAQLTVCGMCGILSDSAYPTGVEIVDGPSHPVRPAVASWFHLWPLTW